VEQEYHIGGFREKAMLWAAAMSARDTARASPTAEGSEVCQR
jgi:hypothetical protein